MLDILSFEAASATPPKSDQSLTSCRHVGRNTPPQRDLKNMSKSIIRGQSEPTFDQEKEIFCRRGGSDKRILQDTSCIVQLTISTSIESQLLGMKRELMEYMDASFKSFKGNENIDTHVKHELSIKLRKKFQKVCESS